MLPIFRQLPGEDQFKRTAGVGHLAVRRVGALMVALSRLDCVVVGYASCEIDPRCKRLTRTRWPAVIELGSVEKVDDKTIELLAASVGYKLDLVIVGAGSPCQDLSGLNATRRGLAGEKSRLFFEVPRVLKLAKRYFKVPVETFVENVASMIDDNVVEFSKDFSVFLSETDRQDIRCFWKKRPCAGRGPCDGRDACHLAFHKTI